MSKKPRKPAKAQLKAPRTTEHRCWGRHGALYLKRCGRMVSARYCADHRAQGVVLPLIVALSGLAIVSDLGQVSSFGIFQSAEERQLRRDAYTKLSLIAHSWKNAYFSLHPEGMNVARLRDNTDKRDVWQVLLASDFPTYSKENWARYHPLFNEHLEAVRNELQNAQAAYVDILSPGLRSQIEQTRTQLTADKTVYYFVSRGGLGENTDKTFRSLFHEVFLTLGKLDGEVQRLRDEL